MTSTAMRYICEDLGCDWAEEPNKGWEVEYDPWLESASDYRIIDDGTTVLCVGCYEVEMDAREG
jgi:hypothetical protein